MENEYEHYTELATAFLHGKLYFEKMPALVNNQPWADTTFWVGKYYWPLGIFPALVMVPFIVVFGSLVNQGTMNFIFNVLTYWLLYSLAKHYTKNELKSLFLAFAYVFASAYIYVSLLPFSWYYAHVVATFCIFSSLYVLLVKDKPFISGIFFGAVFLTRISLIFGIGFYLLYFLLNHRKEFWSYLLRFFVPLLGACTIFFIYNYLRFGNILETGYSYQILYTLVDGNRQVGMWNLRHFPVNLYLLFLKGPEVVFYPGSMEIYYIYASKYGLSMLVTSPIFLWLLFAEYRHNNMNKLALSGALPIFVFLMGSYGTGAYQYGYRFALDFQPFLFLILVSVFASRKLNPQFIFVTLLSVALNTYLLFVGLADY